MKCIIFGAGATGRWAFKYFGRNRVLCFVDNHPSEEWLYDRKIISYDEMLALYRSEEDTVIVVASEKYWEEMEAQLKSDHIERYFVFHEIDLCHMNAVLPWYYLDQRPMYFSYQQLLSNYDLKRYGRIAVYGVNQFLPYLLLEIKERNPDADIRIIPQKNYRGWYHCLGFAETEFTAGIKDIDAIIINSRQFEDNIRFILQEPEDKSFDVLDLYDIDDFQPQFRHKELEVYKDIHKGKRIFVIGSGPSLQIADLNTLHRNREICIASNFTYRAYNMTPWRADYYCMGDGMAVRCWREEQKDIEGEIFIGDSFHYAVNEKIEGLHYFHRKNEVYYPSPARFSDDLTKGLYDGATVTYLMIQLAAYMGAREIILLGVDHGWKEGTKPSDTHFIKNYITTKDNISKYNRPIYRKDSIEKAYEGAELYSRKRGFRIFNATRGGCLEVFERVDFDGLFS